MSESTSSGSNGSQGGTPMTTQAAARIQSATAKAGGGQVAKGSFAGRAQSAAAQHAGNGKAGGGGKR